MGRLSELRAHVNYELEMIPDPKSRTGAVAHLYGVSLSATMLAKKRGLDPELASMAAMLHDLWAYKNGSYEDYAHRGAALAREILEGLGLTSPEETEAICQTCGSRIASRRWRRSSAASKSRATSGRAADNQPDSGGYRMRTSIETRGSIDSLPEFCTPGDLSLILPVSRATLYRMAEQKRMAMPTRPSRWTSTATPWTTTSGPVSGSWAGSTPERKKRPPQRESVSAERKTAATAG